MTTQLSKAQLEASLNEYKGHLFEYLVAEKLAQYAGSIEQFYSDNLPHLKERLVDYESLVRKLDRNLLTGLPVLAEASAGAIKDRYDISHAKISLVGRQNSRESSEGDIKLTTQGESHFISLKLASQSAVINSKSGGIHSFIVNYFSVFSKAESLQNDLNLLNQQLFEKMAHELHAQAGIEYEGGFHGEWNDEFSSLPGQLPEREHKIILDFYHRIAQKLAHSLYLLYEEDQTLFKQALLPLLGATQENQTQVITFYQRELKLPPTHYKTLLSDQTYFLNNASSARFTLKEESKSSFDIVMDDIILHLRVKPMRSYTVPGLKVNCGLTFRGIRESL